MIRKFAAREANSRYAKLQHWRGFWHDGASVMWGDELADEMIVFTMCANLEPVDTARNREPECPEIEANSDAVKLAVADRLEMQ